MNNYTFHITMIREVTVDIEAESILQAERIAHAYYNNCLRDDDGIAADVLEVTVQIFGAVRDDDSMCV